MARPILSSPHFLVLGLSGAGKQTAVKAFEQLGYATLSEKAPLEAIALLKAATVPTVVSVNNAAWLAWVEETDPPCDLVWGEWLNQLPANTETLVLSASDAVLVDRLTQSPCPDFEHDRQQNHPVSHSLAMQKAWMLPLLTMMHPSYVLKTDRLSAALVHRKLARIVGRPMPPVPLHIELVSFGFKHGVPDDIDFVFDMRFIQNPFYDKSLRPLNGLNTPIQDYVLGQPGVQEFLTHWLAMVETMIPLYEAQDKEVLILGIGCTGGKHRSVCMASVLEAALKKRFSGHSIRLLHRDLAQSMVPV